jgi:hypothetical protein
LTVGDKYVKFGIEAEHTYTLCVKYSIWLNSYKCYNDAKLLGYVGFATCFLPVSSLSYSSTLRQYVPLKCLQADTKLFSVTNQTIMLFFEVISIKFDIHTLYISSKFFRELE